MDDRSVGVMPDGSGFTFDGGGCKPKTCQDLAAECGMQPDGCNGVLNCGTCSVGFCGGGGSNKCGTGTSDGGPSMTDAGPPMTCVPKTASCQSLGYTCGYTGDGCGGVIDCNQDGGACTPPEYCGGKGFNQCGGNTGLAPDGGVPCTPKTCQDLGYTCGYGNDGCGNLLNCNPDGGSCPAPQFCGGNGFNQCGGNSGAGPDGGPPPCTPLTCADLGFTCGPAGDGCGNILNCYPNDGGACAGNTSCGGGGIPGQCGTSCTGLCQQQPKCDGGAVTTITGKVVAGTLPIYGTPDPVPNVLVYVPNGPLLSFTQGAQCSQCGADVSGNPLVSTTTAFDGTFTLANVPAGNNIPLVIQLGRWRREIRVNIPACATTAVSDGVGSTTIRMPRNKTDGYNNTADIPLTAISTGSVDFLECVLLKMGVDAGEFTSNASTGRIHIYSCAADNSSRNNGPGNPGASAPGGSQCEEALMGNGGTYMNYDQILLPCWEANGKSRPPSSGTWSPMRTAADASSPRTSATPGSTTTTPSTRPGRGT